MHATRMGPAIRHATAKLDAQDAKTKILFLISDGRPQDRGYSREGVEKEYAVHDTHMALVEAKRQGRGPPSCLTVDKSGHDYLKTMCGDMSYEVLGQHLVPAPKGSPSYTACSRRDGGADDKIGLRTGVTCKLMFFEWWSSRMKTVGRPIAQCWRNMRLTLGDIRKRKPSRT